MHEAAEHMHIASAPVHALGMAHRCCARTHGMRDQLRRLRGRRRRSSEAAADSRRQPGGASLRVWLPLGGRRLGARRSAGLATTDRLQDASAANSHVASCL